MLIVDEIEDNFLSADRTACHLLFDLFRNFVNAFLVRRAVLNGINVN